MFVLGWSGPGMMRHRNMYSYFMQIVGSVDAIYNNPILEKFWRKGTLVSNPHGEHPYNSELDTKYENMTRWFLLNTNYDAKKPWTLHANIPVFAIANVYGEAPHREWLLYCFSPLGNRDDVIVEIPDYKNVNINSSISGQYTYIKETDNTKTEL